MVRKPCRRRGPGLPRSHPAGAGGSAQAPRRAGPSKGGEMPRRPTAEAEREERRRRDRERLEKATAELLTSEGWRRWLRTRSVLHGYSLQNTLLIAQQCHTRGIQPTHVAGFKAWLKLGRCVKKGQGGGARDAPARLQSPPPAARGRGGGEARG